MGLARKMLAVLADVDRALNNIDDDDQSPVAQGLRLLRNNGSAAQLGIWIPWARVRKRRFFYNNTRILDEGLDYLATGFDIFKGWLIVTVVLVLFYALPMLGIPFLQEGFSLLLVFLYPWALNQCLRFNARNLAWRDVRFDFKGSYLCLLYTSPSPRDS